MKHINHNTTNYLSKFKCLLPRCISMSKSEEPVAEVVHCLLQIHTCRASSVKCLSDS